MDIYDTTAYEPHIAKRWNISAEDAHIMNLLMGAAASALAEATITGVISLNEGRSITEALQDRSTVLFADPNYPLSDVSGSGFAGHFGLAGRDAQVFNDISEMVDGTLSALHQQGRFDQDQIGTILKLIHVAKHAYFGGDDDGTKSKEGR